MPAYAGTDTGDPLQSPNIHASMAAWLVARRNKRNSPAGFYAAGEFLL